jgi:hypothetical protein
MDDVGVNGLEPPQHRVHNTHSAVRGLKIIYILFRSEAGFRFTPPWRYGHNGHLGGIVKRNRHGRIKGGEY